ncbi:MAG TPA: PAS domain S-box protein [Nitrospirota bacterium]|nr:PAS domain S-box protein [Nitrospirota bacterium]
MKSDKTGAKMKLGPSFPIVGIGASAGGLNALHRFLAVLPQDFGFALVFIQHLSPKHKSLLQELLSVRRPSLVIQQISDGLKILPGRLYLAPPGREVRLRNGLFQTTVHPEGLIHLSIDEFFSSLAKDAGARSIAVIFSGAGTDGARGCNAVRAASGTVFVQDPQTAEFDSMPLAAMATGQADAVLSPEDIAAEILKFQGLGEAAVNREYPITPEEFDDFFRLLQEKSDLRFNYYKKSVVGRRISRRMYLQGCSGAKEYLDLLSTNDDEAARLASDFMIGVTSFFRDRVAWKALNREVVRNIAAGNTDLPIRVWTPASATGEEAYSIATMLLHELELAGKKRDIQVFATDLNERALERAREGKYPASIVADVPREYIQKYFTPVDAGMSLVVNKSVRECVVFAKQDLMTDPPFSKLDLIICRNFLIYLEPEAQEKSISLFHYALKEGGFLFLGNAETVGRKSRLFQSIGHKQCRVYRKLDAKPASRLPLSAPHAVERPAGAPARQAQLSGRKQSYTEIIQEKLLQEYAPAALAIDQNYEIIYHNGPTNRYLSQPRGVPTQNLLELLPQDLRNRIRGAVYQSGREEKPVVIRTSMAGDDNRKRQVSLRITKIAENLHIVVFQEKGARSPQDATEQIDATAIEETAIHQLESELLATRADIQSHIEQLKSLNEELQSSNEELQAANEELETSREELQSLNEELITVNAQLQEKIEEQDATNNDLNNFLSSTNIPTIFLDTQFRVKRFTPAMLKLIKLIPSDLGRPISDMFRENLGPDLISDAEAVLESLVPRRRELELGDASYVRAALPYRTAENRIEGVVITYSNVTELKRAEDRTRHLASFPQLNPNPVIEVDTSGSVIYVNPGTEKILESLGMDKGEATAFLPKELKVILNDLAKSSESSVSREVTVKDRVFSESIQLVPQFNVARLYAYDITKRKRAEEALRKNELMASALINAADESIWLFSLQDDILAANATAARRFGMSVDDIVGKKWTDFISSELAASRKKVVEDVVRSGSPVHFEDERKGIIFDHTAYPVRDETGEIIAVAFFSRDITERKRMEEALQNSEELFRLAVDNMPVALGIYDAERRYKFVNAAGLKRMEIPLEALVGRRIDEMYDEETLNAFWPSLMRAYETGETQTVECALNLPTGRYDLIITFVPMLKDGQVYQVLNFTFDITERKKAEEAQGLLAAIVENAEDAIIGNDLNGIIHTWNVGAEIIFGYKAEEVIGKPISLLVPPGHADEVPAILARIKRGENIESIEAERLRKDGTIVPVSVKFSAVKDTSGRIIGASKISHDITERKRAQEERETMVAFLRLMNECRGTSDLVRAATEFFQQRSGCDAVGIRVHEKDDYPYFETRGFSDEFVQLESRLCSCDREGNPILDSAGNPVLACMCGNVICGRFDPSKPFFTKRGSFWTNSTSELLAASAEADWQARTRNRCNGEGYESVALIGLTLGEERLGLLQLNDKRKGRFTLATITLWERLADYLAVALAKFRTDEALRASQARYRNLFETMSEGCSINEIVLDDTGKAVGLRILEVNPAFERHTGLKAADIVGRTTLELFPTAERVWFERYGKVALTGEPAHFEEWFGPLGRGFEVSVYRPEPNRIAVVFFDITERKKAEADIMKLSENMAARNLELESVNRELDAFNYSVSHDLRAPLRTVSGFSKIIYEDYADKLDAQGRDYLARIKSGSDRMTHLIDDLLRLSRISRQDIERIDYDLSSLASAVINSIRAAAPPRDVETVIAEGLLAVIDPNLMKIALTNLFDNAWKFTSKTENAHIEFGAVEKDAQTVYFVKDNGAGFDQAYAEKMFRPFQRLHSEKEFEGTGIGLAIVERIIRRHEGRVWAAGEVGNGATIYFTLGQRTGTE